jgi:hypothetical protein
VDTNSCLPAPNPTGASSINSLMPENDGGYIAVWDDPTNNTAIVEHRDGTGTQTWQRTFPTTDLEDTRVVFTSASRTLWCSPQRWFFMDNASGATVASGLWDLPDLDPHQIIIQNGVLYVISGNTALAFDTNMTSLGTITHSLPAGYWRCYEGTWLVNQRNRTEHTIRIASLDAGLQVVGTCEIPLVTDTEGGYAEHRVLSADANTLFVASSLNWGTAGMTFFTLFDRSGNVLFQNRMPGSESLTASAVLEDSWLLSGLILDGSRARQYLMEVDRRGVPHRHVLVEVESERPQRYIVLNTFPPRALRTGDDNRLAICNLVRAKWGQIKNRAVYTPTYIWRPTEALAPTASTNYFWLTTTRLNNTPPQLGGTPTP